MSNSAPIIIIGAARSGTKFLRDLLALADNLKAVPYDVNYIWRYGIKNCPHDQLDPENLTEKQAAFIRKSLCKQAKLGKNDRLLEKTVSNTLRVPYVDAVFPNARYVHLIRDGRDVTESAMRQWQAKPELKSLLAKLRRMPLSNIGYAFRFAGNLVKGLGAGRQGGSLWGPRFEGISQIALTGPLAKTCALQWANSVEMASRDLARLPASRVFTIHYEDLIKDDAALRGLVGYLNLSGEARIVAAWKDRVRPRPAAAWQQLAADDKKVISAVLAPVLAKQGYS